MSIPVAFFDKEDYFQKSNKNQKSDWQIRP
jgi:hypothetical protein